MSEDMETQTKVLAITPDIENELKKAQDEGWEVMPGTVPVAVYQLQRKKQSTVAGIGRMIIDESKILVIKASDRNGGGEKQSDPTSG